jgi:ABC-type transport system involved in cytochrome c biogenesis permease subunit
VTWRDVRLYVVPLLALTCAALYAALAFPHDLNFPPPLMQTLWYPLHVPLSFFAYALWAAAAAAGAVWFLSAATDAEAAPAWLARVDRLALYGFALWSISMICGGIWGVVAWGAYFMWDVKIIWSVILWFHYASFIHLRLTPSLLSRPWLRPALALVGFLWVLVAYVGTSFFFGRSSHAF